MKLPVYDSEMLQQDKTFVFKKLDFTEESFKNYVQSPVQKHSDFKTEQAYWDIYFKTIKFLKIFKPGKKKHG